MQVLPRTRLRLLTGMVMLAALLCPVRASAQMPPPGVTGCSTTTWNAMVNQSMLETRREVVINQRLILKPDSILAYSCYGNQMTTLASAPANFSESQRWVNRQIDVLGQIVTVNKTLGTTSLDNAINSSARAFASEYILSSFNHGFLGGTIGGSGNDQVNANCGTMARIWQAAKCSNPATDPGFPRFEDLVAADPRLYPPGMECGDTGITADMIAMADEGPKVGMAVPDMLFNMLAPPGGGCYGSLATGVTIFRREGSGIITNEVEYSDGVCVSPGCHFNRATCVP